MVLKEEMRKMGFQQLFKDSENPDGYIITSFLYPRVPQFVFKEFYKRLSDAGKKKIKSLLYEFDQYNRKAKMNFRFKKLPEVL